MNSLEYPEIEVTEFEAANGTTVLREAYLKRGARHFELNIHLEKWEHPDTIADYLAFYAEMLREKKVKVNDVSLFDN